MRTVVLLHLPDDIWSSDFGSGEYGFRMIRLFKGIERNSRIVVGRSFICNGKSQYAVSIYLSGGKGILYLPHGNPDGSGVNLCKLTGEASK